MRESDPVIPWRFGELVVRALQPGAGSPVPTVNGPGTAPPDVPPGRWAVSARTEVPFVQVACGQFGTRVASWGDVIEIPRDARGTLSNASLHAGDVVLEAIGTGAGYAARSPGVVTVPTALALVAGGSYATLALDTRLARRAYLCLALDPPGATALPYRVRYRPIDSGAGLPWTGAAGTFDWTPTAVRYCTALALGVGEGEQREPAPSNDTLPTPRPHALSDSLRVYFTAADFAAAGLTTSTPAVFLLEY